MGAIATEISGFGGRIALSAKHLESGAAVAFEPDRQTPTASTIKVPILIELYRQVEAGTARLDERLVSTPANYAPGSGVLRDLSLGVDLSARDTAILMIVISDNTATNMLIDRLGLERINQTMTEFGFPGTRLVNRLDFPKIGPDAKNLAVTTAGELAGVMEALATGRILNDASRDDILAIMRMQHYRDQTPRYLPFSPYAEELGEPDNGLRIANKTGGWKGMRADMALIEWPGGRYVIGIVSEDDPDTRFWPENEGEKVIGRISRLIYDAWGGPNA
jgi:beta-lactamase class A